MEVRALCLAVGLLAALCWPGTISAARPNSRWGSVAVVLVFGIGIVGWVAWKTMGWAGFWYRNPFQVVPLDSVLVGYAIGHILAGSRAISQDTQREHAKAETQAQPGTSPTRPVAATGAQQAAADPSEGKDATSQALNLAASFVAAFRGTVTGVAVVALMALGVVPPYVWSEFILRLEGVKAAGVEVALGSVVGDKTAQAISIAAPPPGLLSGTSEDRHGFIPPRLERMINLTYPVKLPDGQEAGTVLRGNPTHLLFAGPEGAPWPGANVEVGSGTPVIRAVQRDRAMLLHIHLAGAAMDTRYASDGPGVGQPSAHVSDVSAILPRLQSLGAGQERILARLGRHVACVNEVISATNDRRLTEYRTARVVEELYMFAQAWSSLERINVMARLDAERAPSAEARNDAFHEMLVRASLLTRSIKEFTWWADNTIQTLRAGYREPTTANQGASRRPIRPSTTRLHEIASKGGVDASTMMAGAEAELPPADSRSGRLGAALPERPERAPGTEKHDPVSDHCDFRRGEVTTIEAVVNPNPVRDDGTRSTALPEPNIIESKYKELFGAHGFTPYLTTLVAQALSAMGDHNAALRVLVRWHDDMNFLVDLFNKTSFRSSTSGVTSRHSPAHMLRVEEGHQLLLAARWYRLTTFVDTIVLQELSENTDYAVIPTEAGLRYLVVQLFPDVLSQISQNTMLWEWRDGKDQKCRLSPHSWRQSLVLSYATWVKAYLDKRNRNLIEPSDVSEMDLEMADTIARLDLKCFYPDVLGDDKVFEHRAHFAVTAAAIKLNRVVDKRFDTQRREDLRVELQSLIRRAVDDLENVENSKLSSSSDLAQTRLERLVFSKDLLALRTARSIKKRLDDLTPK